MGSIDEYDFSAPPEIVSANALLFDFDGTIIDSTPAVERYWHKQGNLMGIDGTVILATSHGRRSIDIFRQYDPAKANWEYISAEEARIPQEFGHDAIEIPGARKLLTNLEDANAPWAVVTSGTRGLVNGWLDVLKLASPRTMVTAEDVEHGKPDPSCYLLGRKRLGMAASARMIVVEDAPAGVRAGKAAGFQVIGLATTHKIEQVKEAGADWIVRDLASVRFKEFKDGKVRVEISDALVC